VREEVERDMEREGEGGREGGRGRRAAMTRGDASLGLYMEGGETERERERESRHAAMTRGDSSLGLYMERASER
jgi:hypothetical protein